MRRRRSKRRPLLVLLTLLFLAPALGAGAQGGVAKEGALFLLLPVGARAVALGQAVVADEAGSEGVWWNPAALARTAPRELALHHSQTFIATGDALTLVLPRRPAGTLALSVNVYNYGEQETTDPLGTIGTLSLNSLIYAATYAAGFGRRVNAGITFKVLQLRASCSGACQEDASNATSSALDVGLQYRGGRDSSWSVGVALRHAGLRLQVKDEAQADPLPTRLQAGGAWSRPLAAAGPQAMLRLSGDLVEPLTLDHHAIRLGAELSWGSRVALRAGYVAGGDAGKGPSVGVGYGTARFAVDIARFFDEFASQTGEPPIYLSLRYRF